MIKRAVKQKIGLFFALVACILFWVPLYEVRTYILFIPIKREYLALLPNLASGLLAIVIIFLIHIRGIISFKSKRLRLASLLINWALFATFLEIIISPLSQNPNHDVLANNLALLLCSVVFIVVLLFGVKEIAKIVLLLFIIGSFFANFILVSNAMGFVGFIALALIITSFYLQGNINIKVLGTEARYLFAQEHTVNLIDSATREVRSAAVKTVVR